MSNVIFDQISLAGWEELQKLNRRSLLMMMMMMMMNIDDETGY